MVTTTDGHSESGYLPPWATSDPSERDLLPHQLSTYLADITHAREFPGQTVLAYSPTHRDDQPVPAEILHTSIVCTPYAPEPEPRIPVATIQLADETWLTDLDPDDLSRIATQLRTQADLLQNKVLPALVQARADWPSPHTIDTPDSPKSADRADSRTPLTAGHPTREDRPTTDTAALGCARTTRTVDAQ
ncbi:DUF6907 domain-containing protein [Actinacidiphila yanglinensis]|nr:hypothetical protein [Actinacidiphila yanglinensis]